MINNKISSVTDYLLKMDELEKEKHKELLEKIEKLGRQLDVATKALKKIDPKNIPFKDFHHRGSILWDIARKALKEIEEVK